MVDEEAPPDLRARVDLDAGERPTELREHSRGQAPAGDTPESV